MPGCQCADDQVLSNDGRCVAPTECSCFWNGREYFAGESRSENCNICECHKGAWECTDRQCELTEESCGAHSEFVQCMKPTRTTCFNMHIDQKLSQHFDYHCESGCQCHDGYVFEEESGNCILAESCPCYHGGRSYRTGESFMIDCNTCTCEAEGDWICSKELCDGVCVAYGDSHIQTFDGKQYQFQGECEYRVFFFDLIFKEK